MAHETEEMKYVKIVRQEYEEQGKPVPSYVTLLALARMRLVGERTKHMTFFARPRQEPHRPAEPRKSRHFAGSSRGLYDLGVRDVEVDPY